MSLFGDLVPKMMPAEVQAALDTFEGKLDRIIELLELVAATELTSQGFSPGEVANLIVSKLDQ
jgi:hypothetical protein